MRPFRWQILIALGGFALVVLLLVGQGPQGPIGAALPAEGGAYTEALVGRIVRLNPLLDFANQPDRDVDRLIYRGLIRFDARALPQPDLAEGWSVSADGTLYTVTLRDDAFWHDGVPVTSDDVIYTFSQFQDPDYPGPPDLVDLWQAVNIIRLDELSVQFQLSEAFAPFLDYLSVGLLPDHLLRGAQVEDLIDHPFNLEPVGTGPFRFERFLLDNGGVTGVVLAAFDDFYAGRAFLDRVEFRTYPTVDAALTALTTGEVRGFGGIPPERFDQVLPDSDLQHFSARLPRATVVFLNLKHPEKTFLAEKEVRQALLLAVNRQWMIDEVLDGQGILAIGPLLPGTWAAAETLEPVPFDPAQAAGLLEARSWSFPTGATAGSAEYVRAKDDVQLRLTLSYADEPGATAISLALQEAWAQIGVQAELDPVDPADLNNRVLEERDFEALLTEIDFAPYPDPDPYPFWHDTQIEGGQNYSGFSDRNSSIWLERARTTPDLSQRADFYRSFQHRFQDQLPALFLFHPVYSYAIDAAVQGVTVGPLFDPSDRLDGFSQWYLVARRTTAE